MKEVGCRTSSEQLHKEEADVSSYLFKLDQIFVMMARVRPRSLSPLLFDYTN